LNIRVVGVSWGIAATQISFNLKDNKTYLLDKTVDEWVSPEDITTVMLALV
jgi:hypothetical protein